ncbi:MAG: hypothetical protein HY699_17355 [Deltaproteobacteria bacterium]|nr:hypothetical protein [Deltaproteobacteria bacterium]
MAKIDLAKEEIAYLKLWLGIAIATGISFGGWLLANAASAHWALVLGDLVALASIFRGIVALHASIEDKIRRLEDL